MSPGHRAAAALAWAGLMTGLWAGPVAAQDGASLRSRLRALAAPALAQPYAEEMAADRARIAAAAPRLFAEGARIVLFTDRDCPDCPRAAADLSDLAKRLGVAIAVHPLEQGDNRALWQSLGFDIVPAYVMPDKLIRGHMPAFVLERYLVAGGEP